MRRRQWIGPLLAAGIALSGCGNDNRDTTANSDPESWAGTVVGTEDEVELGQWKGPATALTVDCSGDPDASVTVEITAPGQFVATSTQPRGRRPVIADNHRSRPRSHLGREQSRLHRP